MNDQNANTDVPTELSLDELTHILSLYAGDFAGDYDLEAAAEEWRHEINARIEPWWLARNGDLFGPYRQTPPDVRAVADDIVVDPILQSHER